MRALAVADRRVEVVTRDDPAPGEGQVVVAPHSCGICGSDVHIVDSGRARPGQILGHELAGTVAAVGRGVDRWREGDAVVVNPLGRCGQCDACRAGLPFLCAAVPNVGLTAQGGMAEYLAVPATQLVPLPEEVGFEAAAHTEPLAVALHAVHLAGDVAGRSALVYGIGPIGLCVTLALRALGAGQIVAVGRSAGRRRTAAEVGADEVLDASSEDVGALLAERGPVFDAAFECSGAPAAFGNSLSALRPNGTVVEVALPSEPAPVDLRQMVGLNLHLAGSCAFAWDEFDQALSLMVDGAVDPNPLISRRASLDEGPDAFVEMSRPKDVVGILVQPGRQ
jgi:threonine dehydrogenase-like Zn-dependent dehydrogenase